MSKILSALAVLCALAVQAADTYDERIPFVVLSGNEYIDTGYVPHCRNTRVVANMMILERPESPAGLMGTFATTTKSGLNDVDSENWAVTVGKNGSTAYIIRPNLAGSISNGYFYPTSNSYDEHTALRMVFVLAHGWISGGVCGVNSSTGQGYYDDNRPDKRLNSRCTFFIGDVNKGDGTPATAAGSRLKSRWFSLEIYENDQLIHEYVPVQRGGIAGMFDLVDQKFFSAETGALKGPQYYTMKNPGTAAINYESGASYVGGKIPGYDGVIQVPANTTIYARYQDMGFLKTIGGVDLPHETSRFVVTNGSYSSGQFLFLAGGTITGMPFGGFYGKGVFETRNSDDSKATYGLYLCGDCRMFSGSLMISNAAVYACTRYCLGGADAHVYYNANNGKSDDRRRFTIRDPGVMASIHYIAGDNFIININSGTYTNRWYMDNPKATGLLHGNGTVFAISGELITTHSKDTTLQLQAGAHFVGPGEKSVNNMQVLFNQRTSSDENKKLHPISARVHCTPKQWAGGLTQFTNFRVSSGSYLTFGRENCFDPWSTLMMRWVDSKSSDCRLDLNGYDQQVGFIGAYIANWNFPADADSTCAIHSETPATLTIYEGCMNNSAQADSWRTTFPGVVTGQASIELNATNTLRSTGLRKEIGFVSPENDTTGALIARQGTVRLWATAGFPNLSRLELTNKGVFDVRTSNIGNAGGNLCVVCSNFTDSATIKLDSGVTLAAHTAYVGGRWLAAGTYGSAEAVAASGIPDAKVLPCFSGLGLMTVEEYGSHRQGFKLIYYH